MVASIKEGVVSKRRCKNVIKAIDDDDDAMEEMKILKRKKLSIIANQQTKQSDL